MEHLENAEDLWLSSIAKVFRRCRSELRMSIRELSQATGISPSHIARIETGEFDFTITKFLRLVDVFCLPPGMVLQPALFETRSVRRLVATVRKEWDFQLLNIPEEREDSVIGLVLALYKMVVAIELSENPKLTTQLLGPNFPALRERLQGFSERFDNLRSSLDRLTVVSALNARPYAHLKAMGLIDEDLIKSYLEWSKTNEMALPGVPKAAPAAAEDSWPTQTPDPSGKILLHKVTPERNSDFVLEIQRLKSRLRRATKFPGKKAELAAWLGVPKPRVSEWLRIKEPVMPSGETALQLLRWVRQQEEKQNTPGSVISTTKGKLTPRKDSRETIKSKDHQQK